jgi:hypothetical protein
MANYAVTDWVSSVAPLITVAAEIETYLETIDDTKTIRLINVVQVGSNVQAVIIHNA